MKFTEDHEWLSLDGDVATVGITDHAQQQLGDLVFVELPEVGTSVEKGDGVATLESVKAASDVYAPISGNVTEVNESLSDDPEKINADPYGDGWIVRLQPADGIDEGALLTPDAYQALLDEEQG